jgi:hypothetical protein
LGRASEVLVEEDVDLAIEFAKASQCLEYDLRSCDLFELQFLCSSWRANSVLAAIFDFCSPFNCSVSLSQLRSIQLDDLVFNFSHSADTPSLEDELWNSFIDFALDDAPRDRLHSMQLSLLK